MRRNPNVFVAALRSGGGGVRQVLRGASEGRYCPIFSNGLWLESEDLRWPADLDGGNDGSGTSPGAGRAGGSGTMDQSLLWLATQLADESDDHLIELAVAGGARAIVTHNVWDLRRGELRWRGLSILTPSECLEQLT